MTTAHTDPTELADEYSDNLFRFFRSQGIAYSEAQDLAQETFKEYLQKDLSAVRDRVAYLWGIAKNKLLQSKTRPRDYDEYRSSLGPEALTTLSQQVDRNLRVQALLMQLNDEERTVFLLRCEGLTVEAISEATEMATIRVKRRLAETRRKIDELGRVQAENEPFGADDIADYYQKM